MLVQEHPPQGTMAERSERQHSNVLRLQHGQTAKETWAHLWECPLWAPMWQSFVDFTNELLPRMNRAPPAMFSPEFVYLGVMRDGHVLPRSLSLLHSLIWKFQIQDMYQRSQNEYYAIKPSETNKRALRRLMTRIHAHEREAQIRRHKAEQKGGTDEQ